jgi:hypothetical protein
MVAGLGMSEGVALARVWLIEQEEGVPMLELKASVGLSVAEPGLKWTRTELVDAWSVCTVVVLGQVAPLPGGRVFRFGRRQFRASWRRPGAWWRCQRGECCFR